MNIYRSTTELTDAYRASDLLAFQKILDQRHPTFAVTPRRTHIRSWQPRFYKLKQLEVTWELVILPVSSTFVLFDKFSGYR